MKSFFSKIIHLPFYIHLLVVIAVSIFTVYGTLKYIDFYTNHNQAVIVPDIKKLQIEDAASILEQKILRYEVIDSVYSKEFMPGAIVELTPEVNARVKKNRIIYITVNAKTEETAPMPEVTNVSFRQAYADIKSRGFKFVEVKKVSGEHLNLTIGVEYNDELVNSGDRIPLSARLTLLICDGIAEPQEITIDDEANSGTEKDWF